MANFNPYKQSIGIRYEDGSTSIDRGYQTFTLRGFQYHTVMEGETLQSIAFKYYGDSGYWVAIADYNEIIHPFKDIQEGMQLLIPY